MATTPTNLLLIGLRASGKTTAGRLVADALNWAFVDLDDLTAARLGASTPAQALNQSGLDAFRQAEARALEQTLSTSNQVIALGGGTPTAPGATDLIDHEQATGSALVVYLRLAPSELADRLAHTDLSDRPSLTGKGVIEEIADLFDARDPLYRALADLVIEADALTIEQVVDQITTTLNP